MVSIAGFRVGGSGGKGLPLHRHENGPSLRLFCGAPGRGRFLRVFVPPRCALVPLTDVRADTVSAGGSVSRPLPRFDARRDASRLGLDLACGYRSEGLLGMPGESGNQSLPPKPLPHPKNGSWAILGPHSVGIPANSARRTEQSATGGVGSLHGFGGMPPRGFQGAPRAQGC